MSDIIRADARLLRNPPHPGESIREDCLEGMTVSAAAHRLGVSRITLSRLINRHIGISPSMALKLEAAGWSTADSWLRLQAQYDLARQLRRAEEAPRMSAVETVAYQGVPKKRASLGVERRAARVDFVPSAWQIRQAQISGWASKIGSRERLAVLLRVLVRSTGRELARVDFPGNESSQSPGWDGVVEANEVSPWIPRGLSYWEFGCGADPSRKAQEDYNKRTSAVSKEERAASTFVFVTPRIWKKKQDWVSDRRKLGHWKHVQAYDADSLEQWLESSVAATAWFAEEIGLPLDGVCSLDHFWKRWSGASEPPMSREIFAESIHEHRFTFEQWLNKPCDHPLSVAADSEDEALAFLACLIWDERIRPLANDSWLIVHSPNALTRLAAAGSPFLPIVRSGEVERELATIGTQRHCIVVRPRNRGQAKPDLTLGILSRVAFGSAIAAMGLADCAQLARESGRSPTILRRTLSKIDSIKTPVWAEKEEVAKSLIPIALIGAWNSKQSPDCQAMNSLAGSGEKLQESVNRLKQLDDCPIWQIGDYYGVASQFDALFAVRKWITEKKLNRFFELANAVLASPGPTTKRGWASTWYGPVRLHSDRLRTAVRETLVILAVHGGDWAVSSRDEIVSKVSDLVKRILAPLTLDGLLAHAHDLRDYAEAAPDEFLGIVEADMANARPATIDILKPPNDMPFGGSYRSGLLQALECLAWNPRQLRRVTGILARLSETALHDNWFPKPITSLKAIYRSSMPQTVAGVRERTDALRAMIRRYPQVAWTLCVGALITDSHDLDCSYRPRWRRDIVGAGQPATKQERELLRSTALELALSEFDHDERMLGDLVEKVHIIPDGDQSAVWDLIAGRANRLAERAKVKLWNTIRRYMFTLWGQGHNLGQAAMERARETCAQIEVFSTASRALWRFVGANVEVYIGETDGRNVDFIRQQERIDQIHEDAMRDIWPHHRLKGIKWLLDGEASPFTVGEKAALCIQGAGDAIIIVRSCLIDSKDTNTKADDCIRGLLSNLDGGICREVVSAVSNGGDQDEVVRILCLSPFERATWDRADELGADISIKYWREVSPNSMHRSDAELNALLGRLLGAGRTVAAFELAKMRWHQVETKRIVCILEGIALAKPSPTERFYQDEYLDGHYITEGLTILDSRQEIRPLEIAQLELLFIEMLSRSERGIPRLECEFAKSPDTFVWAVGMAFGRQNNGKDPEQWYFENSDRRQALARVAYRLLQAIRRIPGTDGTGRIDERRLREWVAEARKCCAKSGRARIGDSLIGQLLARVPDDGDSWPPETICKVLERVGSETMADGFRKGVRGTRGVQIRRLGGDQERNLSKQYRDAAERLIFDYPFVSNMLRRLAKSYRMEADWWNSEEELSERLEP